jgi:hypothetical protein
MARVAAGAAFLACLARAAVGLLLRRNDNGCDKHAVRRMTGSVDLGVNRWLVEGGCQVPIVLEAVWVGVGLGPGGAC